MKLFHIPLFRSRRRPRCRRIPLLCGLGLVALATTALSLTEPQSRDHYHSYGLLPGVVADIYDDGSFEVNSGPNQIPLLTADYAAGQPISSPRFFTRVVVGGEPGGLRGFSARRDDDNDGRIDEDPLDGRDNDGDGLLDEDYAAIGETMAVWDLRPGPRGEGGAHGEFYHWSYPGLRSTVFLTARQSGGGTGVYKLRLQGKRWQEATAFGSWHTPVGQSRSGRVDAFVAPLAASVYGNDPRTRLWLGVVVLSNSPQPVVVLEQDELDLTLGQTPVSVAICVAESWLQLSRQLNEAARIRQGITDSISGRQASWIVPARCALCRSAELPEFSLQQDGDLILTARVSEAWGTALDPDLFRLGDQALGSPREIRWIPDHGGAVSVPWTTVSDVALVGLPDHLVNPFGPMSGLRSHQMSGRLLFVYTGGLAPGNAGIDRISGVCLDGHGFTADLELVATENVAVPVKRMRQTLSPSLLDGYPNPFRETIQLKFVVPATVGEAFVWDGKELPPKGVDLGSTPPWTSGTPLVSVRIYSINGQELVTLFSGRQGPGENNVRWSGTDSFGRQVASGTYFCKLQLDHWSVTRRLVFLR